MVLPCRERFPGGMLKEGRYFLEFGVQDVDLVDGSLTHGKGQGRLFDVLEMACLEEDPVIGAFSHFIGQGSILEMAVVEGQATHEGMDAGLFLPLEAGID